MALELNFVAYCPICQEYLRASPSCPERTSRYGAIRKAREHYEKEGHKAIVGLIYGEAAGLEPEGRRDGQ